MRTETAEIQELYEMHDEESIRDFPTLVNGIREHVDRITEVCRIVQVLAPHSVLDVGCRYGLFGSMLRLGHGSVKRVVGVDISRQATLHAVGQMGYNASRCLDASEPFEL